LHLYPITIEKLISYTDADWGGSPDTRHFTSGYSVFLGDNLISWSSKRQHTLSHVLVRRSNIEVLPMLSLNLVGYTILS